jgi:uncharacterized surface protein with fasciclin (FAS1) repeats
MKSLKLLTLPLFIFALLFASACSSATPAAPTAAPTEAPTAAPTEAPAEEAVAEPSDIVDIAVADGRFQTLVTALTAAGLVDTLKGEGPFTVFAPTDDAFAALPEGTVEALLEDVPALTDVLLDKVMVNDAQVIITDIEGSNGVIHVIDAVLIPGADEMAMEDEAMEPTIVDIAVADGRFETLVTALTAADLVDTLQGEGPFTVFAPTDDAFAALPEGTVEALLEDVPALRSWRPTLSRSTRPIRLRARVWPLLLTATR